MLAGGAGLCGALLRVGLCGLSTHVQSLAGVWENSEGVSWTTDFATRPGLP